MDKNTYKLLTPGPITTTETVKEAMQIDRCTWDEDYKNMTQEIRTGLLKLAHADNGDYTTVLMQGSGTFGVESVLSGVISSTDKVLVLQNGAYSKRMVEMCDYHGIKYVVYEEDYAHVPDPAIVEDVLKSDGNITHISMVHSETTSGLLNNIAAIGELAKKYNKKFIVDAMSSFGGVDINVPELGITYLVSSANKCIQGVPGFSFIIANVSDLKQTKGIARSLSLDLYAQWETMEKDGGKWRFTSPTHVVRAFKQAMDELAEEGGVEARHNRYCENHRVLVDGMRSLGFQTLLPDEIQSPVITSFLYPYADFNFKAFYTQLKERGFVIYPGKISQADTFRIGNIGDVHPEDFRQLIEIIRECKY